MERSSPAQGSGKRTGLPDRGSPCCLRAGLLGHRCCPWGAQPETKGSPLSREGGADASLCPRREGDLLGCYTHLPRECWRDPNYDSGVTDRQRDRPSCDQGQRRPSSLCTSERRSLAATGNPSPGASASVHPPPFCFLLQPLHRGGGPSARCSRTRGSRGCRARVGDTETPIPPPLELLPPPVTEHHGGTRLPAKRSGFRSCSRPNTASR